MKRLLALLLVGCGGAPFTVGASPGDADTQVDAAEPLPEADIVDGFRDAADGAPEGAPSQDAGAFCGAAVLCDASAFAPGSYLVNYGMPPGACTYAEHTHPLVEPTPIACAVTCGAYTCACLQVQGACDIPTAPQGNVTAWMGCRRDPTGVLIVTCQ